MKVSLFLLLISLSAQAILPNLDQSHPHPYDAPISEEALSPLGEYETFELTLINNELNKPDHLQTFEGLISLAHHCLNLFDLSEGEQSSQNRKPIQKTLSRTLTKIIPHAEALQEVSRNRYISVEGLLRSYELDPFRCRPSNPPILNHIRDWLEKLHKAMKHLESSELSKNPETPVALDTLAFLAERHLESDPMALETDQQLVQDIDPVTKERALQQDASVLEEPSKIPGHSSIPNPSVVLLESAAVSELPAAPGVASNTESTSQLKSPLSERSATLPKSDSTVRPATPTRVTSPILAISPKTPISPTRPVSPFETTHPVEESIPTVRPLSPPPGRMRPLSPDTTFTAPDAIDSASSLLNSPTRSKSHAAISLPVEETQDPVSPSRRLPSPSARNNDHQDSDQSKTKVDPFADKTASKRKKEESTKSEEIPRSSAKSAFVLQTGASPMTLPQAAPNQKRPAPETLYSAEKPGGKKQKLSVETEQPLKRPMEECVKAIQEFNFSMARAGTLVYPLKLDQNRLNEALARIAPKDRVPLLEHWVDYLDARFPRQPGRMHGFRTYSLLRRLSILKNDPQILSGIKLRPRDEENWKNPDLVGPGLKVQDVIMEAFSDEAQSVTNTTRATPHSGGNREAAASSLSTLTTRQRRGQIRPPLSSAHSKVINECLENIESFNKIDKTFGGYPISKYQKMIDEVLARITPEERVLLLEHWIQHLDILIPPKPGNRHGFRTYAHLRRLATLKNDPDVLNGISLRDRDERDWKDPELVGPGLKAQDVISRAFEDPAEHIENSELPDSPLERRKSREISDPPPVTDFTTAKFSQLPKSQKTSSSSLTQSQSNATAIIDLTLSDSETQSVTPRTYAHKKSTQIDGRSEKHLKKMKTRTSSGKEDVEPDAKDLQNRQRLQETSNEIIRISNELLLLEDEHPNSRLQDSIEAVLSKFNNVEKVKLLIGWIRELVRREKLISGQERHTAITDCLRYRLGILVDNHGISSISGWQPSDPSNRLDAKEVIEMISNARW